MNGILLISFIRLIFEKKKKVKDPKNIQVLSDLIDVITTPIIWSTRFKKWKLRGPHSSMHVSYFPDTELLRKLGAWFFQHMQRDAKFCGGISIPENFILIYIFLSLILLWYIFILFIIF